MKTITIFRSSFLMSALLIPPAFAVYPPSTTLANEDVVPIPSHHDRSLAEIDRFSSATDRLEEKERILSGVLRNLQEDEHQLKRSLQSLELLEKQNRKSSDKNPTPSSR